jgi:hypothetical protein
MGPVKQAVAGGQYEYPRGLFFGGKRPTRTSKVLRKILPRCVLGAIRIRHVDFHTGLGPWADYRLLVVKAMDDRLDRFLHRFGPERIQRLSQGDQSSDEKAVAYEVRGDLITWCSCEGFSGRDYDGIAAEFGTYGPIFVISALRAENQAHHWGTPDSLSTQRAKHRLKEVFAPKSEEWRTATVASALEIIGRMIDDPGED